MTIDPKWLLAHAKDLELIAEHLKPSDAITNLCQQIVNTEDDQLRKTFARVILQNQVIAKKITDSVAEIRSGVLGMEVR